MDILILIIIFLAITHFIYEGILAPSIRLNYRHSLFILRDELREIKTMDELSKNDEKSLSRIEQYIETALERLPSLNLYNIYMIDKQYKNNARLQSKIEKIKDSIEKIEDEQLVNIEKKLILISTKVLITNSGGWFIYLIPLSILFILLNTLGSTVKNILIKLVQELIFLPNYQYEKFNNNKFA